jgi:post-segregation antitoxin (ccd killing protein)
MTPHDRVDELERLIRLIIAYPHGYAILLGACAPPSSGDIVRAFPMRSCDNLGIRGEAIPEAERMAMAESRIDEIIREAGGWEIITKSTRQWRDENREDWAIVTGYRRKKGALKRSAERFAYSRSTICRKRRLFPGQLADFVLFCPIYANVVLTSCYSCDTDVC